MADEERREGEDVANDVDEAATEGDAAWRARTQSQDPPPSELQPPPPRGGDEHGERYLP